MVQRISETRRALQISFEPNPIKGSAAVFLWGPRQTGKTTLLHQQFPHATFFDLLGSALAAELNISPSLLRERILAEKPKIAVIDEIQKIPALIEEVHWLLENTATHFILCGSSARKLKRETHNLLGGRAIDYYLFPLTSQEIPHVNLVKALNDGMLPPHYLAQDARRLRKAYVNNYIKEEIIDESLTRNIPAFARFLEVVALSHGSQINYANIAREAGVSASTVRTYCQILIDTLLGFELVPWRKSKKRRLVETAKFYLFDIGVANALNPELEQVTPGTNIFGYAFEHFLINEVRAYLSYRQRDLPLSYWRTSSGFEVDLIVGNMALALEFKSNAEIKEGDLKGLRALKEEHHPKRAIVVSRNKTLRTTVDGIAIMPWQEFCEQLWQNKLI